MRFRAVGTVVAIMALLLSPAAQVLADPHAVAPVASAATQPTPLPPQVAC
ncbi:hypothetical protein HKK72_36880, partial [Actinomadura sp. HBU206391]|nr:hypothetical protein [Actinomadura sp. HBU206391]